MTAAFVAGLIAIAVAILATPLVRRLAIAVGAVDEPGGRRVHVNVTPRLGGVAIVLAYLAAVLTCLSTGLLRHVIWDWRAFWGFIAAAGLIVAGGMVDDIRALGAKKKLFIQVLAASLAWSAGARIATTIFLPGVGPVFIGSALSYAATVVWILAFINAINLVDGLDGLAGGVVFLATVTNIIVAIITGNVLAATLNAALGGAVLGFLFYNFNPATIFMGDTGSMFLGYALGTAALMSGRQKESTVVSLLVPVIALGLPLTDTLLAMVRRVLARRSIFSADREHLHHRLLDIGLTHRRAVLSLYAGSLLLCLAAVLAALGRNWQVGAAITGAVVTIAGIIRFAGYFELVLLKKQQRAALLSGPTDSVRRALPLLIIEATSATTIAGVWAAFERFLGHGSFASAEYCPSGEGPAWQWECEHAGTRQEGKLVESAFALRVFPGSEPGTLKFGALAGHSDPPPQFEILLQVAADAVEAALVRLHVRAPETLVRAVVPARGA